MAALKSAQAGKHRGKDTVMVGLWVSPEEREALRFVAEQRDVDGAGNVLRLMSLVEAMAYYRRARTRIARRAALA